ncbi:2-methylisocitrate lyase-like PEP mutase family enzyme [Nocardioides albertanoniae]|uniref:2-methylisocitrate lyase-like PEP mutase family enzyme n=1 Tax=Nocardioides albertanoniae TaxID=1175486 RepID=A0A543A6N6_9ACTN|nr:isocitrate lyase/phosphoenolpyruvate mutase family protein [Nocardioides albertanoniae]TQL68238.1 2-methylisocitrate lyase-like PEP mutase family enzyme [Nocardioides albertanoniae]
MPIAESFLSLHVPGHPLLMPNAWDAGSAKLLASLGFSALATTSSGYAASLGRSDGEVTRDEVIAHAAALVDAVDVPVSADLEAGFAGSATEVGETFRLAVGAGLAGGSIEDYAGVEQATIYDIDLAAERVAAAAAGADFVLTARAENHIRGRDDLDDTIARLQAYQEAGADVLFAPGVIAVDDVRRVVEAVDRPLSVLLLPGGPSVRALAAAGAARISVGGAFAFAALGALKHAAEELLSTGTTGYSDLAAEGSAAFRDALS